MIERESIIDKETVYSILGNFNELELKRPDLNVMVNVLRADLDISDGEYILWMQKLKGRAFNG